MMTYMRTRAEILAEAGQSHLRSITHRLSWGVLRQAAAGLLNLKGME